MKITGIYKIQSKSKPERVYIGSAVNISRRWSDHLLGLKKNYHCNERLQNHVNKYGINDLEFTIIIECKKEDLVSLEQGYIDSLEPYFNISKIAGSQLGYKHTPEAREKMSRTWFKKGLIPPNKGKKASAEQLECLSLGPKSLKGKKFSKEHKEKIGKGNSKPILQLDLEGNVIREWESATAAALELHLHGSNIRKSCKNEYGRKTCGGFRWMHKEEEKIVF